MNSSPAKVIKFGTDGWRGRIAEDYTFDNVRVLGCTPSYFNVLCTYIYENFLMLMVDSFKGTRSTYNNYTPLELMSRLN